MAASTKANHSKVEVLMDNKQSENTLDTPSKPNKRSTPETSEYLPATSKQQKRKTRHRSTSVGEKCCSAPVCTKKSPAHKKNCYCIGN